MVFFLPAIPFALVLGVASANSELPTAAAWLAPSAIFAGAAHLSVLTIVGPNAWWAAILAGLVVNARHLMYSLTAAPRFASQPTWVRWVAPYFLIDQVFAISTTRSYTDPEDFRRFYFTTGAVFFVGWNVACWVGLAVGGSVPASWRLDFAPAVLFVGFVMMGLVKRSQVVAAVAGAAGCYLALQLPNKIGIIIGGLVGVAVDTLAERLGK